MMEHNSKKIKPGDIFFSLPGGEKYISEAIENGAKEIVHGDRAALSKLANDLFDDPSKKLCVIGVTGTNGKTSISSFVAQALNRLGKKAMVQGTLTSPLTTPESLDTIKQMLAHINDGGTHFVMEVSSHAIAQDRILGIDFDVRLLSNITQDHLDYHGTFEAYKQVKQSFIEADSGICINEETYKQEVLDFEPSVLGAFNHDNLKAAQAILSALGFNPSDINTALAGVSSPPGRFETIDEGQDTIVIVDYAHTPDGLDVVLTEGRLLADKRQGRLISVFGCGGDRDRGKRPLMGKIADTHSDQVIVTLDNPRHESIGQITADILSGFTQDDTRHFVINDRAEAIERALDLAGPKDVVVVAGKGHESVQIIGDEKIDLDDRKICRELLRR